GDWFLLRPGIITAALFAALSADVAAGQTLDNGRLRVEYGPRGITAITDLADAPSRTHRLRADDFAITIGDRSYESEALDAPAKRTTRDGVVYRYRAGAFAIDVAYELKPGWRFVSKQISITSDLAKTFVIRDVTLFRETLAETPLDVFKPTSARPNLGTLDYGAALRFADRRSLLLVAQNPFLQFALVNGVATLRYAPDMEWKSTYGAFQSDRGLVAPVRLSGRRLPARMSPERRAAREGDPTPGLDEAEVAAFTGMVRSLFIYEPTEPL